MSLPRSVFRSRLGHVLAAMVFLCLSWHAGSAKPILPGDILFNDGFFLAGLILDYAPDGTLRQQLQVPNSLLEGTPNARGIVVDEAGLLHVFNGAFTPSLSTYDSRTDTWTQRTFPEWTTVNCLPCSGVAASGRYVFVTDIGGPQNGLVRFDMVEGTGARFGAGHDYAGLTVGLDGSLYAWRYDNIDSPPPTTLDVFDPTSMSLLRSVPLDTTVISAVVDSDGTIYGAKGFFVFRFHPNGSRIDRQQVINAGAIYGMDLRRDGTFAFSMSDGEIRLTDKLFHTVTTFHSLSPGQGFVAFARSWRVAPARTFLEAPGPISLVRSNWNSMAIRLEPLSGSFPGEDVLIPEIKLTSSGTGVVSEIAPDSALSQPMGDSDANGIAETRLIFYREGLRDLLRGLVGDQEIHVTLEGSLRTRNTWEAPLDLAVVGPPGGTLRAIVHPAPYRRGTVLTFVTANAGPIQIRMYDARGRLVRTLPVQTAAPAGYHDVPIDGLGDSGKPLRSGVYFYRIESGDGAATGRLVLAR